MSHPQVFWAFLDFQLSKENISLGKLQLHNPEVYSKNSVIWDFRMICNYLKSFELFPDEKKIKKTKNPNITIIYSDIFTNKAEMNPMFSRRPSNLRINQNVCRLMMKSINMDAISIQKMIYLDILNYLWISVQIL